MATGFDYDAPASSIAPAMRSSRITPADLATKLLERYEADCKYDSLFTPSFKPGEVKAAFGVPPETKDGAVAPPPKAPAGPGPKGALAGVPFVVSANIDALNYATSAGSSSLEVVSPQSDSSVVAALKGAGARLLAQANMAELGQGVNGANAAYGTVKNVSRHLR
jgi:Asp-tRNA(Asn)/Glu-tRNA(Gln) amidotransferase A subunit family amidase